MSKQSNSPREQVFSKRANKTFQDTLKIRDEEGYQDVNSIFTAEQRKPFAEIDESSMPRSRLAQSQLN